MILLGKGDWLYGIKVSSLYISSTTHIILTENITKLFFATEMCIS